MWRIDCCVGAEVVVVTRRRLGGGVRACVFMCVCVYLAARRGSAFWVRARTLWANPQIHSVIH